MKNLSSKLFLAVIVFLTGIIMSSEESIAQVVVFETNKGKFEIELDAAKAPVTVQNFLSYVDSKFYDGTIFHRVIKGFMVQGGGFTADMKQKTTNAPIKIESMNGLKNLRGTIAMARTNDPNSATSQFFINEIDNSFLDFRNNSPQGIGYTVFGKVVSGMETIEAITNVKTHTVGMYQDVPSEAVTIISAKRK